jgi:glycerol-3-phosphate acyltransferase PlsX
MFAKGKYMSTILEKYSGVKPVAVDVLGGDNLEEVWEGIVAAEEKGLPMLLVGPGELVRGHGVEHIVAELQVPMDVSADDLPGWVKGDRAKESSMYTAVQAVKDERASAVFSAGSSGGMYGIAHSVLGFQKRTSRPGIAASIPRLLQPGKFNVLCDSGAHIDPSPEAMVYNALLGLCVSRTRHGVVDPGVAFLSNGEEIRKGKPVSKAARYILSNMELPFGYLLDENIESKHATGSVADVIIADGFSGNIVLKAVEGAVKNGLFGFAGYLEQMLGSLTFDGLERQFGNVLHTLNKLQHVMSPKELAELVSAITSGALIEYGYGPVHPDTYGGAVVPGMNGLVVIGHGSIKAKGIPNAVVTSLELVSSGLVDDTAVALKDFKIPEALAREAKEKYGLNSKPEKMSSNKQTIVHRKN